MGLPEVYLHILLCKRMGLSADTFRRDRAKDWELGASFTSTVYEAGEAASAA